MRNVQELIEAHDQWIDKIMAANEDLDDRLIGAKLDAIYDRAYDTLMVTFGEAQEALTESVNNEIFLRIDEGTLRVVGIEIPHVTMRLADNPEIARLLEALFPNIGLLALPPNIQRQPNVRLQASQPIHLARDLQTLVAAR